MPSKTTSLLDDSQLEAIYQRYATNFRVPPLSYATAEDYCDSFDYLHPLATLNLDLKDVQRPWMLKAILGNVPRGERLLEIGAGEPWVADLLERLGYEVWIVDPYDGSGNGPDQYAAFVEHCPRIHFVRDQFSDGLPMLNPRSFGCIYSISVLEHVGVAGLNSVAAGLEKFLKNDGVHLHAVDHVQRGNGADAHLANLKVMAELFGLRIEDLKHTLEAADTDTETYCLSVESHNRWRGVTPYRDFPMRVCISVQMLSRCRAPIAKSTPVVT